MSHRNVVNCLWGKPFRQFCSSHGAPRLVGQFWGLDSDRVFSRRSATSTCLPALTRRAIAWPIDPAPITTMTLLMPLSSIDLICRRAPPSERDSGLLGLGSD